MTEFEPKVLGILCNWCSYAGADLAGVSRFQYPTNIRTLRVMCSTRVTPHVLLEIFKSGVDGVVVGGCHIGDCHYITGNYYTEKRMALTKSLMKAAGLEPERLSFYMVSASEGKRFAELITGFVGTIKELGPSRAITDEKLARRLDAAIETAKAYRLRLLNGKELGLVQTGNVYAKHMDEKKLEAIQEKALREEFERNFILQLTRDRPLSVKEMAKELDAPPDEVLEQVVFLRQRSMIALDSIEGVSPKYKATVAGGC
jgi:F420-non-reducing hydrogenase iron-sulfur subunit